MEVSRKRIMYTIATNVGINQAQPDVALIVKDNVKKEDIYGKAWFVCLPWENFGPIPKGHS